MAICKMSVLAVVVAAVAMVTMTSALPTSHVISKRAVLLDENFAPVSQGGYLGPAGAEVELIDDVDQVATPSEDSLVRLKRGHNHLPIWVNTFQITDHHGNFKWGVRHNVGHH